MRFKVEPRDVPAEAAARRLGLSLARFREVEPQLGRRGFPMPDPTTGHYDLAAIDAWCSARNPALFGLTTAGGPTDARAGAVRDRLKAMRAGDVS